MNYIISGILALFVLGSGYYMVAMRPGKMVEQNVSSNTLATSQATDAQTPPEQNSPVVTPPEQKTTTITKPKTTTVKGVTLTTNKGTITIELDGVNTPNTAMNFAKLVQAGFYDGIKFHRVIKGFMLQGGDPLTKDDAQMAAWGTGGPGYKFEDEIKPTNRNLPMTLSMANSGPNTNGSQFFINVQDNSFLDSKHTVFGRVTAGMDVVTAIENVKTVPGDRPVDPVIIEKAVLITE
jgi:cyclophilin family peptidyl-prolyl cis-trans isomerase